MVGDIEMEEFPPAVFDDKETVQDSESESRDGKEVHSGNGFTMIAQEGSPELSRLVGGRYAADVSRNGTFRDIKSKFQKFAVNSRCTPSGIFVDHLPDKGFDFCIDFGSSGLIGSGSEAPKQTKTGSMPGNHGFWPNDYQAVLPCRPKPAKQNPKQSI
jgi:hypothetical protein